MTLKGFTTPFGEGLDSNNRWVKLAGQIPWEGLCAAYEQRMAEAGDSRDIVTFGGLLAIAAK